MQIAYLHMQLQYLHRNQKLKNQKIIMYIFKQCFSYNLKELSGQVFVLKIF